jgi:hypothetical protein
MRLKNTRTVLRIRVGDNHLVHVILCIMNNDIEWFNLDHVNKFHELLRVLSQSIIPRMFASELSCTDPTLSFARSKQGNKSKPTKKTNKSGSVTAMTISNTTGKSGGRKRKLDGVTVATTDQLKQPNKSRIDETILLETNQNSTRRETKDYYYADGESMKFMYQVVENDKNKNNNNTASSTSNKNHMMHQSFLSWGTAGGSATLRMVASTKKNKENDTARKEMIHPPEEEQSSSSSTIMSYEELHTLSKHLILYCCPVHTPAMNQSLYQHDHEEKNRSENSDIQRLEAFRTEWIPISSLFVPPPLSKPTMSSSSFSLSNNNNNKAPPKTTKVKQKQGGQKKN